MSTRRNQSSNSCMSPESLCVSGCCHDFHHPVGQWTFINCVFFIRWWKSCSPTQNWTIFQSINILTITRKALPFQFNLQFHHQFIELSGQNSLTLDRIIHARHRRCSPTIYLFIYFRKWKAFQWRKASEKLFHEG